MTFFSQAAFESHVILPRLVDPDPKSVQNLSSIFNVQDLFLLGEIKQELTRNYLKDEKNRESMGSRYPWKCLAEFAIGHAWFNKNLTNPNIIQDGWQFCQIPARHPHKMLLECKLCQSKFSSWNSPIQQLWKHCVNLFKSVCSFHQTSIPKYAFSFFPKNVLFIPMWFDK